MPSGGEDNDDEEEEETPMKKKSKKAVERRMPKLPTSKNKRKAESSDDEDEEASPQKKTDSPHEGIQVGTADADEDRKVPAIPAMPHPAMRDLPTRDPIASTRAMHGMGLLASVSDQMPGVHASVRPPSASVRGAGTPASLALTGDHYAPLPSLTDQRFFAAHAQQQQAARASMAATLAAHANQHQVRWIDM